LKKGRDMVSRRSFLFSSCGAIAAWSIRGELKNPVPENLDHILLGCKDLERGIAFVEQRLGVRAAFGGVHPGRGTQNALLSLGELRYLEIIALDPAQPDSQYPLAAYLRGITEPRLVGWAAHPGDLGVFASKLREAGVVFEGPTPGSRKRPDGRLLQWRTLNLKDDSGVLPFFIEWSTDSPHPSSDAPQGCRLLRFELASPDPDVLRKMVGALSLDVAVVTGPKAQLRATVVGPKGQLEAHALISPSVI
jgi:catechol 2,3-dioxygenase-like lactoylglutathione lyase family enzyme